MDYRGYHPVEYLNRGHLRVTRSKFGSGYVLTGSATTECTSQGPTTEACNLSRGMRILPPQHTVHHVGQRMDAFWEAEDLGCAPLPSCTSCKNCPECRYRGEHLTAQQKKTVEEMNASLKLTKGKPPLKISYPFNSFVWSQVSNHKQAIAVQKSHESRVHREGIIDEYKNEMQETIDAGNEVLMTQGEIDSWT